MLVIQRPQHLAVQAEQGLFQTRFYCWFNLHVICLAYFFGHVLCRPSQTADHLPKPQRVHLIYCSRPFITTYQTLWMWKEPWKNTVCCPNENVKRPCMVFSGILNHLVTKRKQGGVVLGIFPGLWYLGSCSFTNMVHNITEFNHVYNDGLDIYYHRECQIVKQPPLWVSRDLD